MATDLSNMSTQQLQQLQSQLSQPDLSNMSTQQLQQMQAQLSQGTPQQQPNPSFLFPLVRNKELSGAENQVTNNPVRAGKEAAGGALNAIQGFLNLGNKLQAPYLPKGKELSRDYIKSMGVNDEQAGDELLQNIALSAVPEAVPTKGMSLLKRLAVRGAEGETYGEAAGAPTGTGAALSIGLGTGSAAIEKVGRGITGLPAKLLRGTAKPEEMIANANAAGNAPVNIGEITKSPLTKQLYGNVLAEVPGSGVSEQQKQVADLAQQKAQDLLTTLQGKIPDTTDPNELLKARLLQHRENSRIAKNNMYGNVNELAKKENHQLDLSNFAKTAKDMSSLIETSPLLKADSGLRGFMNKTAGYGEAATPQEGTIVGANGKPLPRAPTITEANLAKNNLYNAGESLLRSPLPQDQFLGKSYKRLAKTLGSDIDSSIHTTGSPELKEAYKGAKEQYKNDYARYLDKDIFKYLDENKSSDALARLIVSPSTKKDTFSTIRKIQDIMPKEDKNLLPYAYLKNATDENGKVDSKQLAGLLNTLGSRQYNNLFKNENIRQQAQDYGRFRGMSEDALNAMHNPQTGKRNLKSFAYPVTAAYAGAKTGAVAGPIGAAVGAISSPLALIGGSRMLGKYLSNPETRDKLLMRMLDQERIKKGGVPSESTLGKVMARLGPRLLASQQQKGEQ